MDIRDILKKEKIIVGYKETMKALKEDKIKKIFLASNCSDEYKDKLIRYAKLVGVEIEQLKVKNDELGIICKKPFSVSVLSY